MDWEKFKPNAYSISLSLILTALFMYISSSFPLKVYCGQIGSENLDILWPSNIDLNAECNYSYGVPLGFLYINPIGKNTFSINFFILILNLMFWLMVSYVISAPLSKLLRKLKKIRKY